jgi:hypothetical protein
MKRPILHKPSLPTAIIAALGFGCLMISDKPRTHVSLIASQGSNAALTYVGTFVIGYFVVPRSSGDSARCFLLRGMSVVGNPFVGNRGMSVAVLQ